jgi:sulfatase maturation enzyme AslB (radical SAM superfamily)
MARKTRTHKRRRTIIKTRKHCHNHKHKHSKSCKCKCKYCYSAKKGSHTRARRGGTQTAIGGNMIYKGGQWYSFNPVGGRS